MNSVFGSHHPLNYQQRYTRKRVALTILDLQILRGVIAMLRKCALVLSATFMSTVSQGADVSEASSKNTYSVTLENLQSGEKSKITVSGPADSEDSQTKDLTERLARDAFNGDTSKQLEKKESSKNSYATKSDYFQNIDGSVNSKFLLPKDYVYVLPGYSNGPPGVKASIPGYSMNLLNGLAEENTKLREVIKLQEDQIKLLQDELSSLQGKSK
jgi:hypothetical protein